MPEVHVSRLREHPANIREDLGDLTELAASIAAQGILQPIVVQPHLSQPGCYQVLAGHRRLAAAKALGLDMVPVTVRRKLAGPGSAIEVMLVENCQRRDLGPMEKAEAMGALRNHGYTATRIAQAIGLTISTVCYYLSLLDLDDSSRQLVRDNQVAAADAVGAVRAQRKENRKRQGLPPRRHKSVTVEPEHFSWKHPLADKARIRCQLAGHEAQKYGRESGSQCRVACGACWEYVIRADERGEQLPADEPPPGVREERMRVIAGRTMLDGTVPDGERMTTRQAAELLGVTKRTIERYKHDLRKEAVPCA